MAYDYDYEYFDWDEVLDENEWECEESQEIWWAWRWILTTVTILMLLGFLCILEWQKQRTRTVVTTEDRTTKQESSDNFASSKPDSLRQARAEAVRLITADRLLGATDSTSFAPIRYPKQLETSVQIVDDSRYRKIPSPPRFLQISDVPRTKGKKRVSFVPTVLTTRRSPTFDHPERLERTTSATSGVLHVPGFPTKKVIKNGYGVNEERLAGVDTRRHDTLQRSYSESSPFSRDVRNSGGTDPRGRIRTNGELKHQPQLNGRLNRDSKPASGGSSSYRILHLTDSLVRISNHDAGAFRFEENAFPDSQWSSTSLRNDAAFQLQSLVTYESSSLLPTAVASAAVPVGSEGVPGTAECTDQQPSFSSYVNSQRGGIATTCAVNAEPSKVTLDSDHVHTANKSSLKPCDLSELLPHTSPLGTDPGASPGTVTPQPSESESTIEEGSDDSTSTDSQDSSSILELVDAKNAVEAAARIKTLEAVTAVMKEAGLESSSLIFGIDYTASNKYQGELCFGGRSLHAIREGIHNPYQQVISIVGRTLQPFASSGVIHVFGFGDAATTDVSVFPLKPNGYCSTLNEVLNIYNKVTPQIILSGPTNFAPLIYRSIEICREVKDYHILVIIADGQVTNERLTIKSIVAACKHPLSIIVVGVGDGPWKMMRAFGESLPIRPWDNFHFVEFHQLCANKESTDVLFAIQSLLKVPDQYKQIKSLGLLDVNKLHMPLPFT